MSYKEQKVGIQNITPKKNLVGGNKMAINGLFGGDLKRDLEMESVRKDIRNNDKILLEKIDECLNSWNLFEKDLDEKIFESTTLLNANKRKGGSLNQQPTYLSPFFNNSTFINPQTKDPVNQTTTNNSVTAKYTPNTATTTNPKETTKTTPTEQSKISMIDQGFKRKRQDSKKDRNIQTLRNHYGITKHSSTSIVMDSDDEDQYLSIIKILKQLVEKFISPIEGVNLKKVTTKKGGKAVLIFSTNTTDLWLDQYNLESNTKKEFINRLTTLESIKPFNISTIVEKVTAGPNETFWSLKLAKKYKIKKIPFNVFDMSLEEIMNNQKNLHITCPIPIIFYHLSYMLVKTGGLFAKEVFRISPSSHDLEAVINQISKGNYDIKLSKSGTACYIPATLIKQIFSSMNKKKPILEEEFCEIPEGTTVEKHAASVFKNLSSDKQNLFKFLAAISRKVVHNNEDTKINMKAIAMLFGPTVFPETISKDTDLANQIQNELKSNTKKQNFLEALLQNIPIV